VLAALEAQTDRQFQKARREGRFEMADAYRADALVALLTGQGILTPKRDGDDRAPTGDGGDAAPNGDGGDAAPNGDGGDAAPNGDGGDAAPNGAGDDAAPTRPGPDPRATVSVVVDLGALRRGSVGEGERCEIPGVGPVAVEYARTMLGRALVEVLIAKGTDVTTVYSAGRHVPRRVRSALLLRDPRCVVPHCDARLGLEDDHWVTDFANGGLTGLDNLARLCRKHHLDRTHRGFELTRTEDGWVWTAPHHPVAPKRPKPKRRRKATAPPPGTGPPRFDPPPDQPPPDRRE
jgi:5-methylcytosine-specific restriction endonuclease McrA